MRFEDNHTYWVLLAIVKYSSVPWFVRNTGIPTTGRTTSIHDAKRFTSRDDAIEWGNHLTFPVAVRKVAQNTAFTITEEK